MPSPTSWSAATYTSLTYNQQIDALLYGFRWASTNITYSFPGYSSLWSQNRTTGYGPSTGTGEPWSTSFSPLSTSDQIYFAASLQKWANIANLQFTQVADTATNVGDIRAAYSYRADLATALAWAAFPNPTSLSGDVWFNSIGASAWNIWTLGSETNFAVLHELGHALGLKHPFESSGLVTTLLPTSLDTQSYTIMSYSAQAGAVNGTTQFSYYPTTPMILDIQAIQNVYGANNSYHAGNDTYSYSDAAFYHETIWDAGGTDTIQYSGISNSAIDLRPGYGSHIGWNVYIQSANGTNLQAVNNVWIAYNVTIENAIGGSGNDVLTGNNVNNNFQGSAGNDVIDGGAGIDTASYNGNRANHTVTQSGTGFIVTDNTGTNGIDTLANIDRLVFADSKVALDIDGAAGQVYRLYQAAFNRTPDVTGLTNWVNYMDSGMTLTQTASNFTNSAEFLIRYGTNPTDGVFVTGLYDNVLHRVPDSGGFTNWTNFLATQAMTREEVLIGFSESQENHVNVVGVIQNGITLNLV